MSFDNLYKNHPAGCNLDSFEFNSSDSTFKSGVVRTFSPIRKNDSNKFDNRKAGKNKNISKNLIIALCAPCIIFSFLSLYNSFSNLLFTKLAQSDVIVGDVDVSEDLDDYISSQNIFLVSLQILLEESQTLYYELRNLFSNNADISILEEDSIDAIGGLDHALTLAEFYRESIKEQSPRILDQDKKIFSKSLSTSPKIKELPFNSLEKSTPIGSPVEGKITSHFGRRYSPFSKRQTFHTGIDISIPSGTPVVASADGVIKFAGRKGGYGKMVHIKHGNGRETIYAHLSHVSVMPNRKIKRGQILGKVGSTGQSTGPHLHYEILENGRPVNPIKYIRLSSKTKKNSFKKNALNKDSQYALETTERKVFAK